MKYLYCLATNDKKYYTQRPYSHGKNNYSVVRSINRATVYNDPDDFSLGRREMESYGYVLVIMTDKEYFKARLRGA